MPDENGAAEAAPTTVAIAAVGVYRTEDAAIIAFPGKAVTNPLLATWPVVFSKWSSGQFDGKGSQSKWAVQRTVEHLVQVGYPALRFTSDEERSIDALKEAVGRPGDRRDRFHESPNIFV